MIAHASEIGQNNLELGRAEESYAALVSHQQRWMEAVEQAILDETAHQTLLKLNGPSTELASKAQCY